MAESLDAKLLKVLRRQARQNLLVDFVLAERGLIPFETKAPQPFSDVHGSAACLAGRDDPSDETACPGQASARRTTRPSLGSRRGLTQKGFGGWLTELMAEMETAAIAATGLRCLSSQLQSSFGAGSRMHGGSDDALTPTPPLAADPPVDADPPVEADPTPDP